MNSILGTLQDVGDLFEIAVFVGLLYVFYIAPGKVVRGEADLRDFAAGVVGLGFWLTAIVTLAGGL